jgi:translation initiation factor IF-1
MAKDDAMRVEGMITDLLPNAFFKVRLTEGKLEIIAHLSGKMRRNNIRCLEGDRVDVEMTPYDLTKGRICYRYK